MVYFYNKTGANTQLLPSRDSLIGYVFNFLQKCTDMHL